MTTQQSIFQFLSNKTQSPTYIFIDGSYFSFYRYHAVLRWMKYTQKDESVMTDPFENPKFIEKLRESFSMELRSLSNKLKLTLAQKSNVKIFVALDCGRENIWRTKIYPNYKATRTQNDVNIGLLFQMIHTEKWFYQENITGILCHPHLEADDCIALYVKHLCQTNPPNIYIIASDKDYLQLARDNVKIVDLKYQEITTKESSTGNPETDLKIKIIMGDKSDNIPAIFPKCGMKTALKLVENPVLLEDKLTDPKCKANYELNQKLVHFDFIPSEFVEEFLLQI